MSGLLRSRKRYFRRTSSFVLEFSSIGNGGVSDSDKILSSSGLISIAPVARFSLTAPERFSTVPTIATTNSLLSFAAFSRSALSVLPSSKTTWISPERSRTSTKTSPPLFLFFCTHPMMVTFSPMFASESSAHRCVLFSPVIDSAILISPPAFLFPYKSITESL